MTNLNPKMNTLINLLNQGKDPIQIGEEMGKLGYVLSDTEFDWACEMTRTESALECKLACTLLTARWAATHGISYKMYRNKFCQGRFIVVKEAEYYSLKSESINHTNY